MTFELTLSSMKTTFFAVIVFFMLGTCSPNANQNPNCRFLLDISVNESVNLTLPQYSQLPFAGNSVYIANAGNAGIIIASIGTDFYAWDAADPNHEQSSCSVLVNSGLNATCSCDDKNEYSLINGLPLNNNGLQCSLKNYRVEQSGDMLYIYN